MDEVAILLQQMHLSKIMPLPIFQLCQTNVVSQARCGLEPIYAVHPDATLPPNAVSFQEIYDQMLPGEPHFGSLDLVVFSKNCYSRSELTIFTHPPTRSACFHYPLLQESNTLEYCLNFGPLTEDLHLLEALELAFCFVFHRPEERVVEIMKYVVSLDRISSLVRGGVPVPRIRSKNPTCVYVFAGNQEQVSVATGDYVNFPHLTQWNPYSTPRFPNHVFPGWMAESELCLRDGGLYHEYLQVKDSLVTMPEPHPVYRYEIFPYRVKSPYFS